MLQRLGLDWRAEAVYRALLVEPCLGLDELCERLTLPEEAVREALDDLVRLTLVYESRDRPGRLRPRDPRAGLEVVLRRQEAELASRQREIANARARIAEVVAEYAELRPNTVVDGAERLFGLDTIQERIDLLAIDLAEEWLGVMPGPETQKSLDASRPLDEAAAARGVRLRALSRDCVRRDSLICDYGCWLISMGGQMRTAPVTPPHMLIFDRHTALIPINPGHLRRGVVCTSEPAIVAALVAVHEQAWERAVPLEEGLLPGPEGRLSPLEQELLKLLAGGLTDEAVAKRLGVSGRTVRRQMAVLMDRLEATSRFEAGYRAAQRGWL